MKLFFDENLSPRLVKTLAYEYPGSSHVRNENMRGTTDANIWEFCRKNNFIIVSKDTDFQERSFLQGAPPKVIWLAVGNAGTDKIANLLRQERHRIEQFIEQHKASLLILSA